MSSKIMLFWTIIPNVSSQMKTLTKSIKIAKQQNFKGEHFWTRKMASSLQMYPK
jgi:hypothetical protein